MSARQQNSVDIERVPTAYYQPAESAGRLKKLAYSTYDAFSYRKKSTPLNKYVWVYLPYNYTETESYPIFYLSHGGWSDQNSLMGTADQPTALKHILDHAIADGKILPMIIVLVTYNNLSSKDSWNYDLAIRLTRLFHQELIQDILPAVEGRFSTYAESVSPKALKASRRYRGFGGFSMGSVNTWRTFEYALDYFYAFVPMSGNTATSSHYFAEIVKQKKLDFMIYACSGTQDFAYQAFKTQIQNLADEEPDIFRMGPAEAEVNLIFRELKGGEHTYEAGYEYLYNALPFFWS